MKIHAEWKKKMYVILIGVCSVCSGISDPILRVIVYSAVYMHIYGIKTIISTIYSRLSLSRTRLSRITAYLEVKIWSLL